MAPWPPLAHAFLLPRVRTTLLHVGTKVHRSQRGPHVPAGCEAAPQQPIPMAEPSLDGTVEYEVWHSDHGRILPSQGLKY